MIVVEGPDGAGKTTLIENITRRFEGIYVHPRVVSSDTQAMVDLKRWVEEDNQRTAWTPGVYTEMYDRHRLISEFIYGPILRYVQEPGFDDYEWVDRQLYQFYSKQPLIIYCLPPLEQVKRNVFDEATDNRVVAAKIDAIWVAYARLSVMDRMNNLALIWDYTQMDMDAFIDRMREEVRERRIVS